ncbi:MAG: hypothetical protein ING86_01790 [Methylobacterium sp.]|nr:hypothetical protein [Methylobacterium sp.]
MDNPLMIGFISNFLVPLAGFAMELFFEDRKWVFRTFVIAYIIVFNPFFIFLAAEEADQSGPGDYILGLMMLVQAAFFLIIYCFLFLVFFTEKFVDYLKQRREAKPGAH